MTTTLYCSCGSIALDVTGTFILSDECCCTSCRQAADILHKQYSVPAFTEPNGSVAYVLYRKDRVAFIKGVEHLRAFKLSAQSPTRRVVALCCGTPVFLEFSKGHWLSLNNKLWPAATRPKPELRIMVGDMANASHLSQDIPNAKTYTFRFYWKLMVAYIAMGFRTGKVEVEIAGIDGKHS
jgi:hypothetical protein